MTGRTPESCTSLQGRCRIDRGSDPVLASAGGFRSSPEYVHGSSLNLAPRLASKTPFFYGWVVLGSASSTQIVRNAAASLTIAVFMFPLAEDLGWSRTLIAGRGELWWTCCIGCVASRRLANRPVRCAHCAGYERVHPGPIDNLPGVGNRADRVLPGLRCGSRHLLQSGADRGVGSGHALVHSNAREERAASCSCPTRSG